MTRVQFIANNLTALAFPSVEEVAEKYHAFLEARGQRDAQDEFNREFDDVRAMSGEVDAFIRDDLWYEIIGALRKEAPGTRRSPPVWSALTLS